MYILVMYDIGSNAARRRVVRACKDEGLRRVQYSVFVGTAGVEQHERLSEVMRVALGDAPGVIHVMPLHRESLKRLTEIFNPWPEEEDEDGHQGAA